MWMVEERLPIILLGAAATLTMVLAVIQTRRLPAIIGLVGVVLLTLAWLVVETVVVTQTEEVENTLYAAAAAVERNDLATALDVIPNDQASVRHRAEGLLKQFVFSKARVGNDLKIEINPDAEPLIATATFTGHAQAKHKREVVPYQVMVQKVTVSLVRHGDDWKLVDFEIHKR